MDAHWMKLADDNLTKLPPNVVTISNNGISVVYRKDDWVYKRSIPFLIENEIYCLTILQGSGFVPRGIFRYDKYTIAMHYIQNQGVTNARAFMNYKLPLYDALKNNGIRHGDLTEAAILVNENKPYMIDFAESRLANDPRPDKRPEGDWHWINHTFEKLCMKRKND